MVKIAKKHNLSLIIRFTLFFCISISIAQAQKPEIVISVGPGDIEEIAYNFDGTLLASSVSRGKIIHIWDSRSGLEIRNFQSSEAIECIRFINDENKLLCYLDNGEISIWDVMSGELLITRPNISKKFCLLAKTKCLIQINSHNEEFDTLIENLSDSNFNAKLNELDKISKQADVIDIEIIDISSGNIVRSYQKHGYATMIRVSPDEKSIALYCPTGDTNSLIKMIDTDTGNDLFDLRFPSTIQSLKKLSELGDIEICFSPDGRYLCAGFDKDSAIVVFDLITKSAITFPDPHIMDAYDTQKDENPDLQYQIGIFHLIFLPNSNLIVSSGRDDIIRVREVPSGKEVFHMRPFTFLYERRYPIFSFAISPNGKYLAAINRSGQEIGILDLKTRKLLKKIKATVGSQINGIVVNRQNDSFFISYIGVSKWNLRTGSKINSYLGCHAPLSFDGDSQSWVSNQMIGRDKLSPDKKIDYKNAEYAFLVRQNNIDTIGSIIPQQRTGEYPAHIDYNGKYLAAGYWDGIIKVWNVDSGNLLYSYKAGKYSIKGLSICNHKSLLAATNSEHGIPLVIWDLTNGQQIRTIKPDDSTDQFNEAKFSSDGKQLAISNGYGIQLFETDNWGKKKFINAYSYKIAFNPSGTLLAGIDDKIVTVWDVNSPKEICQFTGHSEQVQSIEFMDDSLLLSGGDDKKVMLWDIKNCKKIVDFIDCGGDDFITITSDNYYTISKGATEAVGFRVENKIYPFEQFDLQYNRPDIVLERIGYADTILINAYRKAYNKRLKRMNVNENMFSPEFHIPTTNILNSSEFAYKSDTGVIILKVKFSDNRKKLNRYNIWINDVPLYGSKGVNISNLNTDSLMRDIPLKLSQGENKIQASCFNENYAESLKEEIRISYNDSLLKPDLYFLGLGVSTYSNERKNLRYASKDAQEMAKLCHSWSNNTKWRNIYIDTLINAKVKKDAIMTLKTKLLRTHIDDQIIVFYSGHGVLDDSLSFYLASYDMDFGKPGINGISYETLEWILDSIPARNKLLLIDACQSGEVDKDIRNLKVKTDTINDALVLKGSSVEIRNGALGLQSSLDLLKELFSDIDKGTGSIVISASGGLQSALESNAWGEGAFTYSILKGLGKGEADKDHNNVITVGELKNYVSKEVELLTNGKQKPTTRKENLSNDFEIWKKQ